MQVHTEQSLRHGLRRATSLYTREAVWLTRMTVDTQTTVDGETVPESHVLDFTYDASGNPQTMTCDGVTYYYSVNIQGDVMAILDENGTIMVHYIRQGYGLGYYIVPSNATGSMLNKLNPFGYRGYVRDRETYLYYLESRYYSEDLCRFLNADALVATGQGLLGNNMFAYCRNNPVIRIDISGDEDAVEIDLDGNPITDDEHLGGGGSTGNSGGTTVGGPGSTSTPSNSNNGNNGNSSKRTSETTSIDGGRGKTARTSGFRRKLQKLTGQTGEGKHAHHMFPVAHADKFKEAGIDINDPKNGAWWEAEDHLRNAHAYNDLWTWFFNSGPYTADTIRAFGELLGWLYGLETNFD